MTIAEAIDRFVPDGATVALGTSLEPLIPFAAGHELIRQRRQDLELVGPISDSLFDELIGAGCVRRITPARTLLGSDILRTNPNIKEVDGLVHIGAVRPDVTILHVQRCDAEGRAHAWGPLGISEEAGLAAERVIISCEELVDAAVTLSDPNRVLLPETKVVAVVHEPGGSHPSPVQGFWKRDHALDNAYAYESRTREGYEAWLKRWVLDVPDRQTYMTMVDVDSIRITGNRPSEPVNFADD